MIHPEERIITEPTGKKSSIIMAFMLFLTIASVAFFGYLKSQGMELNDIDVRQFLAGTNKVRQLNETSDVIEIPYDSKEHPVFGVHMEYLVKCSRDGIWLLDKKGREIWSVGIPLSNPLIKTNGNDLLVVDVGGRDIYVINGKNVRWKDKTDEKIQNAEINENGYVTVITTSKRYNGEVRVYDNHGIELFRSIIANDFAVTAKIAPSKDQMVINLINASGVKSHTYLKFFDINGNELVIKNMSMEKGLYPFVWFTSGGSLFAAGDTSIVCMDKESNIIWEKQFLKISSACITGNKRLAVAVEKENVRELKVFTAGGQAYSSVLVDGEVNNISTFGSIIAVNTGREVSFLTEKGKNTGEFKSRSDITGVFFFDRQQAAVVTKSYVAVVNIN